MNIYHVLGLVGILIKEIKAGKDLTQDITALRNHMAGQGVGSLDLNDLVTTFNRYINTAEKTSVVSMQKR